MSKITLIDNNTHKVYDCYDSYAAYIIGVHKNTISRWRKKALMEHRIKEIYNQYEIIFIDEEIKQPIRNVNTKRYM